MKRINDPFGFVAAINTGDTKIIYTVTAYIGERAVNSVTYADTTIADAMFDETVDGARKLGIDNARVTITCEDQLLREYVA